MYLKSLEIQGFKSFPDKTRLVFEKPITAIVGPNGSGKSNISDAILWVMGEQSTRTLRGGKMEDVIFGGTQKRGQVGFAEVSLIIDNTGHVFDLENTEVMITRRYYRSGESEYSINKQEVRLRDVVDLLMDTGLGRDGYSVIGQGKIDAILSAKSTDRREIFEEAAGISRFRRRKEESERKLEHTEENLVRINDKVSELELQVEPLREQAETAKKYLVLRDELRGLEISAWMDKLDTINIQTEKLCADYSATQRQLDEINSELEQAYEASEAFAEKMRTVDVEAEALRTKVSEAASQVSGYESDIAVFKTKLESNMSDIERIKSELKEQEGRDGGIKAQVDELKSRITGIAEEKARIAAESEGLTASAERLADSGDESTQKLTELMKNENNLNGEISEAGSRLSALASAGQEMLDRENAVSQDIAASADKLKQLEADGENCAAELDQTSKKLEGLKNAVSGYAMRLDGRQKKAQASADRKMKLKMEQNALKSRITMLTEMEKEYAGYSGAVKLVMQESARGILKNIHGTVAGLIETDDRYAVAIETALGGSMQNIIVGSEEDGKAAINLLKRRDGGRATFLPLTTVRGKTLNISGLDGEEGYEGTAISLVRFDAKYSGVYASLLGRVAVVESLDDAIRISRRCGNGFKIVTLDGQVINSGGSMTGGSTSRNSGIISRANELKKLAEQAEILQADMSRSETECSEAEREKAAAEYTLDTARSEMRSVEDSLIRLKADSAHYDMLIVAAKENLENLRAESAGLDGRILKNGEDIISVQAEIADLEDKAAKIKSEIEKETQGQTAISDEREHISAKLSEIRANMASLDAERVALGKAASDLAALRADLTGGRLARQDMVKELQKKNTEIGEAIALKGNEIAKVNAGAERDKAHIERLMSQKLMLEAERTKRDRETQEKNRTVLDLERERARLEQKKLAADMEEKQIIDKLWDTYEISRTVAMQIRRKLDNQSETGKRIAELKREIGKLGSPNIGAIDEYERVNTRYSYLTSQRDDVEKAKKELDGIINDITSEMRTIFAGEFDTINGVFKKTFTELFGGGQASLELEDKNDILNCGIEIKVQPPGKSLKTLTLLSGGEKAFVAIALYFAILKVRPTPFVIMDEIEAALDDANVQRFAEYMRRMSDKTQMIVITHRRGTMEEADILYGVTMQEQGVSRVLSVDLDEAERTIAGHKQGEKSVGIF